MLFFLVRNLSRLIIFLPTKLQFLEFRNLSYDLNGIDFALYLFRYRTQPELSSDDLRFENGRITFFFNF